MPHDPRLAVILALALPVLSASCGDETAGTAGQTSTSSSTTSQDSSTSQGSTAPTTGGTTSSTGTSSATGTTTTDPTSQTSSTTSTATTSTTEATSTTTTSTTGTTDPGTSSTTGTTDTSTAGTTDPGTSSTTGTTDTGTTTGTTGDTTTGEPVGELGYAGMSSDDSLMVFDRQSKQVVAGPISLLPQADYPYDAMITPDGAELWLVGASGDGVKVVDTATYQVTHQLSLAGVGDYPVDVLFSANGNRAYVSSRDSEALVIVDAATHAVIKTVALPVGMDGGKMALDPCTGKIHLVHWYGKNLLTYDPVADKVTSKPLGSSLWDLRIDAAGATLYVTDRGLDVVHVLDVATLAVQATVPVGDDPWGIDITSDGGLVVVACEDDSSVHFIDTGALTTSSLALPAGADPRDVDISADDLVAYVPSGDIPGNDGVFELDLATKTVIGLIDLGASTNTNVVAVTPQPVICSP